MGNRNRKQILRGVGHLPLLSLGPYTPPILSASCRLRLTCDLVVGQCPPFGHEVQGGG